MSRPLWQIAAIRIAVFALLAAAAQLAVVVGNYYFNDRELGRLLIEREVDALAQGISMEGGSAHFSLPDRAQGLFAPASGYFARVRTGSDVLFSACNETCIEHFLPLDIRPPDFWVRFISPGKPLSVAGGAIIKRDGAAVLIEFATVGDRRGLMWGVLWNEMLDHLVVPMSLLLLFVMSGAIISIRTALRPVREAARAVEHMDPLAGTEELPVRGMPDEIMHLTRAVNRAFARMGDLIRSQRLLTSAIAHEVRTPLAVIKLEIEAIDHPRARKAEADVDELAEFVGQLTALARLEAMEDKHFVTCDLADLGEEVVSSVAPWVYAREHAIAFHRAQAYSATIIPGLVRDACRNLIENSVRHTPAGTTITVAIGPGPRITIEDDGARAGPAGRTSHPDSLGIGLMIVERVLALHEATLSSSTTGSGFRTIISFKTATPR